MSAIDESSDASELHALTKELDKLATQEEKQAYLLEYFKNIKKTEAIPQVIGTPEHGAEGAEPCL